MSRALILATLFASLLVNSSWAQNKGELQIVSGPPYPGTSEVTFQWDYSCRSGQNCSFTCMAAGGASHVTKLVLYLGTVPVGSNQKVPAVLDEFSTRDILRANGFSISTGINTLSCQVNGMTLDYSGPPHDVRDKFELTSGLRQNNK